MYFENCIRKLYSEVNSKDYFLHDGSKSDYSFNQVKALSKVIGKNSESILQEI